MRAPEQFRHRHGPLATAEADGNNGLFFIKHPNPQSALTFKVICSDGGGWEHVSVSLPKRCPTWEEMCFIKGLFWGEGDVVVQYHPAKVDYVNLHPFCLPLWRPTEALMPAPPSWMVG